MKNLVAAHLVDVTFDKSVKNPCGEISLPVLMEPREITLLRLRGVDVYDYTESLDMDDELVDKDECRVYR
jgi:hypothetical protein